MKDKPCFSACRLGDGHVVSGSELACLDIICLDIICSFVCQTSKTLCLVGRHGAQVSQVALVADQHDHNVGVGMVTQLAQPPLHVLVPARVKTKKRKRKKKKKTQNK